MLANLKRLCIAAALTSFSFASANSAELTLSAVITDTDKTDRGALYNFDQDVAKSDKKIKYVPVGGYRISSPNSAHFDWKPEWKNAGDTYTNILIRYDNIREPNEAESRAIAKTQELLNVGNGKYFIAPEPLQALIDRTTTAMFIGVLASNKNNGLVDLAYRDEQGVFAFRFDNGWPAGTRAPKGFWVVCAHGGPASDGSCSGATGG